MLKLPKHPGRKLLEAQERQVIGVKKDLNLRNCKLVLHDIEHEVATPAGAKEIIKGRHLGARDQVLPTGSDVFFSRAITALCDE